MKYYIPIKLNRTFTIGPFAVLDAIVLFFLALIVGRYTLIHQAPKLLFLFGIVVALRLRIDDKTILSRIVLRIKFLFGRKEFALKESFKHEKS